MSTGVQQVEAPADTSLILSTAPASKIALNPEAIKRRDALLADALSITVVTDAFGLGLAVDTLRALNAFTKAAEESRVEVKAPVLALERTVDGLARQLTEVVDAHAVRINRLITGFERARREKEQAAERERQAEAARIAREKLEAVEAQRKAHMAAQTAFTPAEAVKANDDLVAADARQADLRKQQTQVAVRPQLPPRPDGLGVSMPWKFEVLDIKAVYAAKPELCKLEISTAAVNALIRTGLRECPGLRIFQEMKTNVR